MKLIVRAQGREEAVEVLRGQDGYTVTVGDRSYQVQAERAGARWSLLCQGLQRESVVLDQGRRDGISRYWVSIRGFSDRVEVLDPLTHLAESSGSSDSRRGSDKVSAYMPGRVVSVLVEVGAQVSRGQGIVVLEAMKMENEIAAESDGVVSSLYVEPGQAVEKGDPLFEVTPSGK